MSESRKRQNFLEGTALLALATALVKVLGALYKIPMKSIIGDQGFGYFNTAYEIYNVLLMISTAGLPVAMSRMISQADSLGHYNQVRRIYAAAKRIFLGLGIGGSLLMTLFCRQLADFQNQPDAWAAIGALGPCVLLICIMSAYRGYFQGLGNMLPTSVSQVLEAAVKLIVGIAAAAAVMRTAASVPLAAGGAILGVTVSCLLSAAYLFAEFRKSFGALPQSEEPADSFSGTAKGLLTIAVPITIGSAGLQILTMLETKIYMGRLLSTGTGQAEADVVRGIYGMAQTIFNMPCSFIPAITICVIPTVSARLTRRRYREARKIEEAAARITGLIAMPCAVGLAVLAEPITAFLGQYAGERLTLAARLTRVLALAIVPDSVVLVSTAILQAHGHAGRPVLNLLFGGLFKLAAVYVLTGNPAIGILGTPIGTLVCYTMIGVLNLISLRQLLPDPPVVLRNLARAFPAACVMGAGSFGFWRLLLRLGADSRLTLCALPVAAGAALYLLCAARMGAITRADCLLLPKGEKIAKLLGL